MTRLGTALFIAASIALTAGAKAEPKVVTSIKPVHSLVQSVMQGVGTASLIVEGAGSPHTYALKPSKAQALEQADLIFWIGHELEAFLEKPIETIGANAVVVSWLDLDGLTILKPREGGTFEEHAHDDHGDHDDHDHDDHAKKDDHDDHDHDDHAKKDDHDDHDHDDHAKKDDHDDHDHDDHAKKDDHDDHDHDAHAKKDDHDDHDHDEHADHEGHDDHHASEIDPHVWLDPANAVVFVDAIEAALIAADPENASTYSANAAAMRGRLDGLVTHVEAEVAPVKDRGFIVFHDAYQYFESRFGLAATGSITVSPEVMPGAARVGAIREKIKTLGATCVFSEPQFESQLVQTVTDDTQAGSGVLDPLGSALQNGPDLYFQLLETMAHSLSECLTGTG